MGDPEPVNTLGFHLLISVVRISTQNSAQHTVSALKLLELVMFVILHLMLKTNKFPDTNSGKEKWLMNGTLPISQARKTFIFKER